jgi:ribosomal protein L11 methyltransferase
MIELSLLTDEDVVEALSDTLLDELNALSVSVEDADADTAAEQALFGEPGMPAPRGGWQRSTVKALFPDEDAATEAAALLVARQAHDGPQTRVLGLREVEDQDWVRLTQSQFAPVEITPSFWIVPTWHEAPAAATQVITLDPGLAFGTGTHPTTRMCLRWIATAPAEVARHWDRVLDYGCGSGILAIGAALFGARRVDAVDIDPAAVESTRLNAIANRVILNTALPEAATGTYQLVLANILATPLRLLAPLLCDHVAPGGALVLAGILSRQADELTAAYAPWCDLKVTDEEDGWILMTAQY